MATEIIDGVGTQNHVTSDQVGLSQAGMIGSGAIILPVGEQLGYDIISNNQVNIKDGVYVIQGKRGWIQTGTVEQCTIDTGNNGQYRNDLICVKYTKDAQSKVEQFAIAVVKGTPGAAGTDPTYTTGDINNGALESYTPIYRVRLNGINIVGVDLMASKINSMLDMVADIGNLTALTTTEKNSLVGAINELKTAINTLNGNFQKQIGKIYTIQEILTDALWIEVSQPFHEKNCYMYRVYSEDTTNMPEGVIAGVRQPAYIFDQWNACVIIVEVYPTYGRIWINHYDGTQWNGWKNISN